MLLGFKKENIFNLKFNNRLTVIAMNWNARASQTSEIDDFNLVVDIAFLVLFSPIWNDPMSILFKLSYSLEFYE